MAFIANFPRLFLEVERKRESSQVEGRDEGLVWKNKWRRVIETPIERKRDKTGIEKEVAASDRDTK